ncbi:MAG: hypothetical protein GY716_11830 [bacterium]|nr:hypothetical protein [bacterium]
MAETNFENVLYEVEAGAAWITVNRPDKLNALNRRTVEEIVAAVRRATDDDGVGSIVLTGSGAKAFVAGADIGEMAELSAEQGQEFARFLQVSLDAIEGARKPVIAAINGFALGGGCELAMACHVRIASDNAKFGQPEVNLGLIPGAGGTQRLPRIVGRGRALDLVLSGDIIDAQEALRIGLANRVVPADDLRAAAADYAKRLSGKSRVAQSRALEAVLHGADLSQSDAMHLESSLFGLCFATEDMREGTSAFLAKRKPEFPGR